jgi:glycine oxidase
MHCAKANGLIIVGATVEPGQYNSNVMLKGMMHCLLKAGRLVLLLAWLSIRESWADLHPMTPERLPILGGINQWSNMYLAGGYWCNGVLCPEGCPKC